MAKQFSKINFQVQTQLGLLDISAQIQFCRFYFFEQNMKTKQKPRNYLLEP